MTCTWVLHVRRVLLGVCPGTTPQGAGLPGGPRGGSLRSHHSHFQALRGPGSGPVCRALQLSLALGSCSSVSVAGAAQSGLLGGRSVPSAEAAAVFQVQAWTRLPTGEAGLRSSCQPGLQMRHPQRRPVSPLAVHRDPGRGQGGRV